MFDKREQLVMALDDTAFPLQIKTNCPKCKHRFDRKQSIKYIVVHYTGNVAPAYNQCKFYSRTERVVSAHFVVDHNGTIYNPLPVIYGGYHVSTTNSDRKCCNANSIAIDMCCYKLNQSTNSAYDGDWYHSHQCRIAAQRLIKQLMDEYKIPIKNVLRHYDVTRKYCPASMCGDDVNKFCLVSGNEIWKRFKEGIINE